MDDAWKSSGAQAYIDRLNANRMYREYAELEGPFIAYWNAHLSANEVKSSEASNWANQAKALEDGIKSTYKAYVDANLVALPKALTASKDKAEKQGLEKKIAFFKQEAADIAKNADHAIINKSDPRLRYLSIPKTFMHGRQNQRRH